MMGLRGGYLLWPDWIWGGDPEFYSGWGLKSLPEVQCKEMSEGFLQLWVRTNFKYPFVLDESHHSTAFYFKDLQAGCPPRAPISAGQRLTEAGEHLFKCFGCKEENIFFFFRMFDLGGFLRAFVVWFRAKVRFG